MPRPAAASAPAACRSPSAEPDPDCRLCPRLAAYRDGNRSRNPAWFNGPVPCFGDADAGLLVVGLAPGLNGANRTGRPFTGDHAGELLYATLLKYGFARGAYAARADDGLRLRDCLIANAVRCAPPENKPTPQETASCRPFLAALIDAMPRLRVIVALGRIAHDSALRAAAFRPSSHGFAHGARHALRPGLTLIDSYHCSRYNTNTGRLTEEMFAAIFAEAAAELRLRAGAS
jgi:uracil-DNA glycosylase family 4